MKFHTTIALIVAALTLTAGAAAAMPGNAPTDAATASDGAADSSASAAQDAESNETDGKKAADASGARGPTADLPAQVPDHVSQIHDLIGQFLAGDLTGSLGEAVSDVAGNDSASPENASADAAA